LNTPGLMGRLSEASPKAKARLTGALYLLTIVFAGIGTATQERLVIPGDAAATASTILAHASLLRWGMAAYLVEMAGLIAVTALFYDLLKPVNKNVSLLAAFFSLVAIIIKTMSRLFYIAPLFLLGGADYLKALTEPQLQALALVFLNLNALGAGLAMAFFGFSTILSGYLVLRSTFLPHLLGVLGVIAGLGWLTFLWLPLGLRLAPYITAFALVAAAAKIGWLLVVGVDEEKWKEQAALAAGSVWR
jgi:hypothetical protein